MEYKPREIPEGVNVTAVHPLVNFAYLLGTVVVVSALVYLGLGAIAAKLALHLPPQIEVKIGQQLLSDVPNLTELESRQQRYLEQLLTKINRSSPKQIPIAIHVQESSFPNAMILPGGQIIVTTTLLETAASENELAFVLAHELGHHVAKDNLKALGRSLVFLTIASVLGLGTGNGDIVTLTGSLTNLHYSRQQETAADIYALDAVVNYYGHGGDSLKFFQRLQSEYQIPLPKLTGYFSTHPLTQSRIDRLHQVAKQNNWQMTGQVTALPEWLVDHQNK